MKFSKIILIAIFVYFNYIQVEAQSINPSCIVPNASIAKTICIASCRFKGCTSGRCTLLKMCECSKCESGS